MATSNRVKHKPEPKAAATEPKMAEEATESSDDDRLLEQEAISMDTDDNETEPEVAETADAAAAVKESLKIKPSGKDAENFKLKNAKNKIDTEMIFLCIIFCLI